LTALALLRANLLALCASVGHNRAGSGRCVAPVQAPFIVLPFMMLRCDADFDDATAPPRPQPFKRAEPLARVEARVVGSRRDVCRLTCTTPGRIGYVSGRVGRLR
jgi:hypothetical protein